MHTFLIVDDNLHIRRSLRTWLETNKDWKVSAEAENGEIAIKKAEQLQPDVVILDFQMPEMNGLEAAREIRLRSPATAIVLLTLYPSSVLLKVAQEAGIRGVVSKTERLSENLSSILHQIYV